MGHPIVDWGQVKSLEADILIIASSLRNYGEIYQRIRPRCYYYDIDVYGINKERIDRMPISDYCRKEAVKYSQKSFEELKGIIKEYEYISFDIFDTLIMRMLPEPHDVLDYVEVVLREKNISIKNYKSNRILSDQSVRYGTIFDIYNKMQELTGVELDTLSEALDIEIDCEKRFLKKRDKLVELFYDAIAEGKHVFLISDMYFPKDIMEDILFGLGIEGYEDIFISCDYSIGKNDGLYERLICSCKGNKCLHIGDNEISDYKSAVEAGIEVYGIKSAVDMMRLSNMNCIEGCVYGINDKILLGLILNKLFNNPFSMEGTAGCVTFCDPRIWAGVCLGPIMVTYITYLDSYLEKRKDIQGVLFALRDGYLPSKVYELFRSRVKPFLPKGHCIPVSRKLAYKMCNEAKIKQKIENYYPEFDSLYTDAELTREYYINNLKEDDIDIEKKYLFSELYSMGTTQVVLSDVFIQKLTGFYLMQYKDIGSYDIHIDSIYTVDDSNRSFFHLGNNELVIEKCFSSLEPSVIGVGSDGYIYKEEERTTDELKVLEKIHEGVIDFAKEFFDNYIPGEEIDTIFPEWMSQIMEQFNYEGSRCNCILEKFVKGTSD